MNEAVAERRRPEAAALRDFFQEQWELLLRLVAGREGHDRLPAAELERAVETLVDGTDGRVRMVFSYRKRLREGVRAVLEHVEAVVAELPPARELSRRSFTADPLINVVFPGADDIPKVLSESAAVQEFIAAGLPPECRHGFSVLAATPQQKRVLGMELIGDRVVRDVQQNVLLFTERIIENAAASDATVFITGESGTGKELAAEALHRRSRRRDGPFVTLNCAAIPRDLLESELFGHIRGAFTGANKERRGAAAQADGGTLFFDEIGEMDLDLQSKLLRFTQTRRYQPVGASAERSADVRFSRRAFHLRHPPRPTGRGACRALPRRPLLSALRHTDRRWTRASLGGPDPV